MPRLPGLLGGSVCLALLVVSLPASAGRVTVREVAPESLPSGEVRETTLRTEELRVWSYAGGPSVAAWRASPVRPLSVYVGVPLAGVAGFVHREPRIEPRKPASETCVPRSYRWVPTPLSWERLRAEEDGVVMEEHQVLFEPKPCKATTSLRTTRKLGGLLSGDEGESLLAFRQGDEVTVLIPRDALTVTDAPGAVTYGAVTRVRMSLRTGGAVRVLTEFPAGVMSAWQAQLHPERKPAVSPRVIVSVELLEGARGGPTRLIVRREQDDTPPPAPEPPPTLFPPP